MVIEHRTSVSKMNSILYDSFPSPLLTFTNFTDSLLTFTTHRIDLCDELWKNVVDVRYIGRLLVPTQHLPLSIINLYRYISYLSIYLSVYIDQWMCVWDRSFYSHIHFPHICCMGFRNLSRFAVSTASACSGESVVFLLFSGYGLVQHAQRVLTCSIRMRW